MPLPKVLIIGQPFNNTGGGITLTNLFKGWDKEKLAVACVGAMANIDTTMCENYYRLGDKERHGLFPFNYLQTKYVSGELKPVEGKNISSGVQKPSLRTRLIMNYFFPFLKFMGLSHSLSKTRVSPEFLRWIGEFQPDILYAQASSREGVLFCTELSTVLKKPFIFHMMDDWPAIISDKGLFKNYWHHQIDAEFRKLLGKADILMSIGEQMSIEYQSRYGRTFIPFQNPINVQSWVKHQRNTYDLTESPAIVYAGRIGLGIEASIETVARAVQKTNEELNTHIRLILHTDVLPAWTSGFSCVEHKPMVKHEALPELFSAADFLLLPYDFSPKSIKYIQYSMPTKAPEYMISGTPIILFAPKETAIVRYAEKYGFGEIITENSIEALSASIKGLIGDPDRRRRSAQRAIEIAEQNHNSVTVTNNFRNLIKSVLPAPVEETRLLKNLTDQH